MQSATTGRTEAVLEVVAGRMIVPAVLGWLHLDASIPVLGGVSLGMLLFRAGMEIDLDLGLGMLLFRTGLEAIFCVPSEPRPLQIREAEANADFACCRLTDALTFCAPANRRGPSG